MQAPGTPHPTRAFSLRIPLSPIRARARRATNHCPDRLASCYTHPPAAAYSRPGGRDLVSGVDIGPAVEQEADDIRVAFLGCMDEARPPILGRGGSRREGAEPRAMGMGG